jgi:hypothetical protein
VKTVHASDCTIFSDLSNGNPEDGICTCGYGYKYMRLYDSHEKMYSQERQAAVERDERKSKLKNDV